MPASATHLVLYEKRYFELRVDIDDMMIFSAAYIYIVALPSRSAGRQQQHTTTWQLLMYAPRRPPCHVNTHATMALCPPRRASRECTLPRRIIVISLATAPTTPLPRASCISAIARLNVAASFNARSSMKMMDRRSCPGAAMQRPLPHARNSFHAPPPAYVFTPPDDVAHTEAHARPCSAAT